MNKFDEILKELRAKKKVKFDETLECQVAFSLPEKNKSDSIRFSVVFDNSFEKGKKILVLTDGQFADVAKKAGADYVGLEDYVKKITDGWMDFDVLIATPSVMSKIAVLGKALGPKGLMPNPKNETVTTDLEKVINMYKKGKADFKASEAKSLHMKFGKLSMTDEALKSNYAQLMKEALATLSKYGESAIKSVYVKSTMSKPFKIEMAEIKALTK